MFKQFSMRLAIVSTLVLNASFGVLTAQSAIVSAQAGLVSLTFPENATLSKYTYELIAETNLSDEESLSGTSVDVETGIELGVNPPLPSSAISKLTGDANDVTPFTKIDVSEAGFAKATAKWTFEYQSETTGPVTFDFQYNYLASIINYLSGAANASATLNAYVDGDPSSKKSFSKSFNNENQQEGLATGNLLLTFNVETAGQRGNIVFEAISSGNITPVPIPAAIWLFGTALAGMVGLRRRHA